MQGVLLIHVTECTVWNFSSLLEELFWLNLFECSHAVGRRVASHRIERRTQMKLTDLTFTVYLVLNAVCNRTHCFKSFKHIERAISTQFVRVLTGHRMSHPIASTGHRMSHPIASHRIASHRIASHRIASHRIASHLISSHLISRHEVGGGGSFEQPYIYCILSFHIITQVVVIVFLKFFISLLKSAFLKFMHFDNGRYLLRRSDTILGTFYRDSLRAQRFQTLIKSLVESIWVWNLIGGVSEGRGNLLVNFSFLRHNTTKLGPQRIMVKSSDAS